METIKAYAKVNLDLKVSKPSKNGYHKIKSNMVLVEDLFDEIRIEKSSRDSFECNIKDLEKSNFILIVMDILKRNGYINDKYKIVLHKNIPVGSGLGGGSSDAVAIANYFLGRNKAKKIRREICKAIGFDTFFFMKGYSSAFVKGFGQKIKKTELKLIKKEQLIFTDVNCETKAVYKHFDEIQGWKSKEKNQLTQAAIELYPQLKEFSKNYSMSGSGSTFFKEK
ncbi:4-diphosphocytidyl-2-C-methyl-D-erythritol kinase [Spiroplasma chinense]|uniref:4-diphosphocytidyl-2-C-methyl-D-erythritol kinase n=1 Tax=Spiroplasma chinense TaxID=216932 RepID=A0A5B9Y6P4_9MOLU|nr:hypothetical protein [Spiroplasma chinense]QEH62406.1 4-diphosphocytidyl-2-C-methyl-D-erythritol kinase [Spiroplasma chinense]